MEQLEVILILKRYQTKILEIKNAVSQIKVSVETFTNGQDYHYKEFQGLQQGWNECRE